MHYLMYNLMIHIIFFIFIFLSLVYIFVFNNLIKYNISISTKTDVKNSIKLRFIKM